MGRQMKEDFSNGADWAGKWEVTFPTGQASKWKVTFPNGTGLQKRNEFSNCRAEATKKRRWLILHVSPGRQKRDKAFKLADNRLITNLIHSTINVNVQMKWVFQFSLQDYKQKSMDFYYYYLMFFPILIQFALFVSQTYSCLLWQILNIILSSS